MDERWKPHDQPDHPGVPDTRVCSVKRCRRGLPKSRMMQIDGDWYCKFCAAPILADRLAEVEVQRDRYEAALRGIQTHLVNVAEIKQVARRALLSPTAGGGGKQRT